MRPEEIFFAIVVLAIFAGVTIIFLAMRHRAHTVELLHRERMAMIERGLSPPPEMEPYRHGLYGPGVVRIADRPGAQGPRRSLTAGIVLIALGLGFMTIIGVAAGEPGVAIGLGGAVVIVGIAFVVISHLTRSSAPSSPEPPASPPALPSA